MKCLIGVKVNAHDLPPGVDPGGDGSPGACDIDGGEDAVVQQKATGLTIGIEVAPTIWPRLLMPKATVDELPGTSIVV